MNEKKPPVKEGEDYSAIVGNVGEKGDGILRIKGFVVFVPGVEKGDYVKINITKVLPTRGTVYFSGFIQFLRDLLKTSDIDHHHLACVKPHLSKCNCIQGALLISKPVES